MVNNGMPTAVSQGMSGSNFDAFVSSQRSYNGETDWAAKIQEKYWRARQKFLSKIERNEDSSIVLSDSKLDSKLGIHKSIDRSCARLTNILENYQNALFVFSNEENALGILLKECGKHDKTKAGKIMAVTGRSLTQSSHQRIRLYMPLMRLYQEMETFHSRAVEDTAETVDKLESKRSQYRASLLWMKDLSEKLDPDIYRQLDKFRRVQNKVREDKRAFDGMQMDVVQKIDLLMASRCNLMNQILAPYQAILMETFERNCNNFKSVQELIESEDIYEYEFKALKQLNPLKIEDSPTEASRQPVKEPQATDSLEAEPVADLLGSQDDNNNMAEAGPSRASDLNLVDVSEGEESQLHDMKTSGARQEVEKELDLLESLFGDNNTHELGGQQDKPQVPSETTTRNQPDLRQRKPAARHQEFRAMRPNNLEAANLFDIDGDEDQQIASLLKPSMISQSGMDLKQLLEGVPSPVKQTDDTEDIFAKWARDADIDLSNNSNDNDQSQPSGSGANNKISSDNNGSSGEGKSNQDLMDLEPGQRDAGSGPHNKERSRFYA